MGNNISISIVILHYNNFSISKDYVIELENQNWENIDYHIIIVDNASPDGSGLKLYEFFKNNEKVEVILSKSNIGFAKGNNLGIKRDIETFHSDLVIISNNDIEIPNKSFMQELSSLYKSYNFDVMGPDIYSVRGQFHQSPIRDKFLSIEEISKLISINQKKIFFLQIIDKLKIYNLLSFIKRKVGKNKDEYSFINFCEEGVVLHGAFFVLSKGYLTAYPDGLYDETFLYMEEDILNYRVLKKTLKSIYYPNLQVLHYEGVSSLEKNGNDRCKKYIFELKETNKSCKSMKKYLESDESNE